MAERDRPMTFDGGELYTHFRTRHVYVIVGEAMHTETGMTMVLYRLYSKPDSQLWARPKDNFREWLLVNDKQVWRFTHSTDEEVLASLMRGGLSDYNRSEHNVV
jgi:hypothetical protein